MIKRIWEDKLLRNSVLLFGLNMFASLLNYLCQLLMARVLSVENFGTINTIFSFLLIVSVPGNAITMIVAKKYAESDNEKDKNYNRSLLSYFMKWVSIITLIVLGVEIILFAIIQEVFNIKSPMLLFLMIVLGAIGYFHPFFSGVFSGLKKFITVGIYALLIPIYKLVAIAVSSNVDHQSEQQLYVIIGFMIFGTAITLLVGWRQSLFLIKGKKENLQLKGKVIQIKESIHTFIINAMLMIYMNLDLIAVRQIGGERESGIYSSVLLFGRIVYYFSVTIATLILPLAVAEKNKKNSNRLLLKALGLQVLFSIICLIPLNLFATEITVLLFGNQYAAAGMYVKYISIISFAISLSTVLSNYMVAKGMSHVASTVLGVQSLILVICMFFIKDIQVILMTMGSFGIGISAILIYFAFSDRMKRGSEHV